jgi:5-methyltetrahydrofolate--homocysteine methyltransferase
MFEGMILLGENLNATRKVRAMGKKVVDLGNGKKGYPYINAQGEPRYLDLTQMLQSEAVINSGMVGYIATGVVNRDEEFIAAMAQAQANAHADYLDCCVDEISPWQKERIEHMKWLVATVQKYVRIPLSIDSSDPAALAAGLSVYDAAVGKPILNSVNLEENRLPTLKLAQETGSRLLGNASGRTSLPSDVEGRLQNLTELMGLMDQHEIPLDHRTLDPLVLPVGTDPTYGQHFLESCVRLRERFGPEFHLTGGFSNVSFGLPNRRLLNEAFTYLAREAGCDTAFIDPLQIGVFRPEDEGFQKAIAALKGEDMFCIEYITYCRSQG